MVIFTAVKPFPFTKAEVICTDLGYLVNITTVDGSKALTARNKEHAIEIANNSTK
jgi:hypothetical protein